MKKTVANLYNPLFDLKTNDFKSQNNNKIFTETTNTLTDDCFLSQLDLLIVSVDEKSSVLWRWLKRRLFIRKKKTATDYNPDCF